MVVTCSLLASVLVRAYGLPCKENQINHNILSVTAFGSHP